MSWSWTARARRGSATAASCSSSRSPRASRSGSWGAWTRRSSWIGTASTRSCARSISRRSRSRTRFVCGRWLHPAGLDQSRLQLQAGQPILLPVEHGVTAAPVRTPSGRTVKAQVNRGVASYTETDEVGIYTVITPRGETRVAVNLTDAAESDLTPSPVPDFVEGARPEAPPVAIQDRKS